MLRMTKLVLSGDMPKNLQENNDHGLLRRFATKNEKGKGSNIRAYLEDGLRVPTERNHSLIEWERNNLE